MDQSTMVFLYNVLYAILILGCLIGIIAGLFLIIRKRKIAGILTSLGFLLISIDPISRCLVYVIINDSKVTLKYYYVYPCLIGITFLLGCIALVVALVNGTRTMKAAPNNRCKSCGALLEAGVSFCEQCGRAVNQ